MRESLLLGSVGALSGAAGALFMLLSFICMYVGIAYGLHLLTRKYEPSIPKFWSWIPLLNIYPFVKLSRKSLWWILGMLIPIVNIFTVFYVSYFIAKRIGYDVGAMLGIVFFPFITLPWLGLKTQKRKTTFAWIIGILGIVFYIFGWSSIMASAASMTIGAGLNPELQEQIKEQISNNPELKKALEEMKNNPEFQEAIQNLSQQ